MLTRVLPSFDYLDGAALDRLEGIAIAAEVQRQTGGKDWPTKPCRQRLDLFLACKPKTVMALINMARQAIRETDHA
jgi:hypothetical protein